MAPAPPHSGGCRQGTYKHDLAATMPRQKCELFDRANPGEKTADFSDLPPLVFAQDGFDTGKEFDFHEDLVHASGGPRLHFQHRIFKESRKEGGQEVLQGSPRNFQAGV